MAENKITIIKEMLYRGSPEEWSNSYHFTGGNWPTQVSFNNFCDALFDLEKNVYSTDSKIVRAYGYNPGHSTHDWVYEPDPIHGTLTGTDADSRRFSGDQAAWIRGLIGMTSQGKGKYLRKYFHSGFVTDADPDSLDDATSTAYGTFLSEIVAGVGGGAQKWCSASGTVPTSGSADLTVTTRTLKRRGRRP